MWSDSLPWLSSIIKFIIIMLQTIQAIFGLLVMIKVFYYFVMLFLRCCGCVKWEEEAPPHQDDSTNPLKLAELQAKGSAKSLLDDTPAKNGSKKKSNKAKKQEKIQKELVKKKEEEKLLILQHHQQQVHRLEMQRLEELKRMEEKLRLEQQKEIERQVRLKFEELKLS